MELVESEANTEEREHKNDVIDEPNLQIWMWKCFKN